MLKLYIWNESVGHASLEFSSGAYISWWPGSNHNDQINVPDLSPKEGIKEITSGVPGGNLFLNHQDEVEYKEKHGKTVNFDELMLQFLNENAALLYWNEVKNKLDKFHLLKQNCSTVVAWTLTAGFFGAYDIEPHQIVIPEAAAIINQSFREFFDAGKISEKLLEGIVGKQTAISVAHLVDYLHSDVWKPERIRILARIYEEKLAH